VAQHGLRHPEHRHPSVHFLQDQTHPHEHPGQAGFGTLQHDLRQQLLPSSPSQHDDWHLQQDGAPLQHEDWHLKHCLQEQHPNRLEHLKDLKQPKQPKQLEHEQHSAQLQHCALKQPQLGLHLQQSVGHEQHCLQLPQGLQPEQRGRLQVQQFGLDWNLQHERVLKQLQLGLQHDGLQHELQFGLQHELQFGLQHELQFGLQHELQFGLQHDGLQVQHELQFGLQHELQSGLQHDGLQVQHELQLGLQHDRLQHELQLELQDGQSGLQHDVSQHEQLLGPKQGLLHDLQLGLQHDRSGHEQQEQSKQHDLLQLGKQWQEQQNHDTHMHNFDLHGGENSNISIFKLQNFNMKMNKYALHSTKKKHRRRNFC
jgi:hypothetical protein